MVMSLTRSAAAAVAGKEIDGQRIPLPKQNIGTMHSFAYRALDRPEIADTPKNIALWNEWIVAQGHPTYRLTVEGGDLDDAATESTAVIQTGGDDSYQTYGIARARLQPVNSLTIGVQGFVHWWELFKQEHDMMDFSEMLERAYLDVDEAPGSPSVFLLDEGQDTPKLGMRLARKWGEAADWFFVVGDPLQNLYHWAGTDPEAFTYPPLPPEQTEILSQSYRVPRKIRDFAFKWIEPHKLEVEQQLGKKIEYNAKLNKSGEIIEGEIRKMSANWKLPDQAIRDCMKYLEAGKDVFFIAACAYMLQPTISMLRQSGIPFHNPYRPSRGDWNPLHATRGTSSTQRLLSFLRLDDRLYGEDVRVWNAKELNAWIEIMESKGLLKSGAKTKIKAASERPLQHDSFGNALSGELQLADLDQWFENLDGLVDIMGLIAEGSALDWFRDHLLSTKRKAIEFPITIAKKHGPQKLRETPKVVVGTIHSLKGAEAEVVYIFPDLSGAGFENWNKPSAEKEGVRRAFYVAFTRASETLVLCDRATTSAIQYPSTKV
jgi:superfamily I DNA/RNA helicase